jgi:pyruvate/2-oxoglutarate dehydrogenase complex dihydrolipoamide dehydrogenase (E3) component
VSNMIVIGGGPAGVTAALEGARLGFSVQLVSAEKPGGRANWHSLLPSKVYLAAADHLVENRNAAQYGLTGTQFNPDLSLIRQIIRDQAERWGQFLANHLEAAGVEVILGQAAFANDYQVQIQKEDDTGMLLDFDKAMIATGSVPIFPKMLKPDGRSILAPRFASKLTRIPEQVIVVGGGVTGSEFAFLFNTLGSRVTWITDLDRMLPRVDPDVSAILETALASQGINIVKSSPAQAAVADLGGVVVTLAGGKAVAGNQAFIAVGRKADIDKLGLDRAGIMAGPNGILISEYCQTNIPGIYAVGDAAGPPFITNRGQVQAFIAARHAAGDHTRPFESRMVVEAVYTNPQVASVGLSEIQAKKEGISIEVHQIEYPQVLKSRLKHSFPGYLKLISDPKDGIILGGAAIGAQAADLMSSVAMAMLGNLTIDAIRYLFPAYPTFSELITEAARGYYS